MFSNDAWRNIMSMRNPNWDRSRRPTAHSVFRLKRQYAAGAPSQAPQAVEQKATQCSELKSFHRASLKRLAYSSDNL
jgi:hypothetical protein